MKKKPNRRALWLAAGSMVLVGMVSGSAGAQPPSPVATVTGFVAVTPYEAPYSAPARVAASEPTRVAVATPRPSRTAVPIPTARIVVVPRATPAPVRVRTSHSLRGLASWYCGPTAPICAKGFPMGGAYAAAGPRLRAAICGIQSCTSWRGRTVIINGKYRVKLIDWCQCFWHKPYEKVIDLYSVIFARTGSVVTIRW